MSTQVKNQSSLPLVRALRPLVEAWREGGYKEGTSETTRRLLEWWFLEDHELKDGALFAFWRAQREAIEHLIYCYEVLEARSLYQLAQRLDARVPVDPSADKWAKYAFKMATGSGKTMVMAMAVVWSYFNATKEKRDDFTKDFLLVAPNLIVLDRLMGDSKNPEFFEGAIFKKFPFIPPEWSSDFQLDVIGPDEERESTKPSTLYLLNWQKFVERENGGVENPVQDILGPKPPSEIAVSLVKLKDRLSHLSNVMVLNDEAHHVWDEELVWYKAIADLNESTGLMCQLDFSATPRDQKTGGLFTHIITEYTLGQAIRDQIVKTPKIAEIENIPEMETDDAAEKYRVQIDAGVNKWRAYFKELKKTDRKPILFIMAENTTAADKVAAYLDTLKDLSGRVLVIHTDRKGEVTKKDLEKARKWAREIDEPDNPYRAVVSVLMLREGWDVRNVKVIVPLRALTAKAKILPEQTLGRGLRRMFWDQLLADELLVIEHPAFRNIIEEALAEEGVEVEFVPVEQKEKIPTIIMVEESKKNFDISVPVTSGGVSRSVKQLAKLKIEDLPSPLFRYKDLKPAPIKMRKRDLLTKQIEEEEVLKMPFADRPDIYIGAITKKIEKYSRVPGHFDELAGITKKFIQEKLFDKKLDFNEEDLEKLNNPKVRVRLVEVFVDRINDLTAVSEDIELAGEELKASEIKPFPWSRDVYEARKTVLNFTPVVNELEKKFAKLINEDDEVVAFIKNDERTLGFRIPYIDADGYLRNYIPDFIAKAEDTVWIIETKGKEDVDVKFKDKRAEAWAKQVSDLTGNDWKYLRVDQKKFEKAKFTRLADLV